MYMSWCSSVKNDGIFLFEHLRTSRSIKAFLSSLLAPLVRVLVVVGNDAKGTGYPVGLE
jgi:hypothetical protein